MSVFLYLINSMISKEIKKQFIDKIQFTNEIYITKNNFLMSLSILGDYEFISIM